MNPVAITRRFSKPSNWLTACLIVVMSAAVSLIFSRPAYAQLDGISEIGHSYQSDARGGCEVSIGDTALAHVRQPASVVLQGRGRFDSKITNIFPINRWSDADGVNHSAIKQLLSYNLGLTHPLGKRSGVGVAWETGGWKTKFANDILAARLGMPATSSLGLKKFAVVANVGTKVTEKFFVGAGPHIEVLRLSTKMPINDGLLDVPTSYAVGAGYQLGALYRPSKRISFGASYASPIYMSGIRNDRVSFATPGRKQTVPSSIGAFTLPARLSFGVSGAPTEKLKVALEAGFLPYGSSIFGRVKLGGPTNARFAPGFKDLWVINVGADYEFSRHWSGSVGYVFNTNPIERQNMVPFYVSNEQNQFTYGLRYTQGSIWTGFAHIIGVPAVSRSAGAHPELGSAYQNSTVRQMLQSFNFGVGFNF